MSPAGGGGDRHHPEVPAVHWVLKVGAARAQRDTGGAWASTCAGDSRAPTHCNLGFSWGWLRGGGHGRWGLRPRGRRPIRAWLGGGVLTPPSVATWDPAPRETENVPPHPASPRNVSLQVTPPCVLWGHLGHPEGLPRGPRGPEHLSPRPRLLRQQHLAVERSILLAHNTLCNSSF